MLQSIQEKPNDQNNNAGAAMESDRPSTGTPSQQRRKSVSSAEVQRSSREIPVQTFGPPMIKIADPWVEVCVEPIDAGAAYNIAVRKEGAETVNNMWRLDHRRALLPAPQAERSPSAHEGRMRIFQRHTPCSCVQVYCRATRTSAARPTAWLG
jgi:hypothetical protein